MMTVAVLAANGRSGKAFVAAALAAGMNVRAGVHGTSTLPAHKNCVDVPCDATNSDEVERLLDGCDAVVSLIGHTPRSDGNVQADAMKTVVNAMRKLGIKRIISLTGTGVRVPGDTPNIVDKFATLFISTVDPQRVRDGKAHAEVLQASQLDWTIVRVLKLTNGTHEGRVRFSLTGPAEMTTPRARVAAAIVQLLQDGTYIHAMPIIKGKEV